MDKLSKTKWFKIMESNKDGNYRRTDAYEIVGVGVQLRETLIVVNKNINSIPAIQDSASISVSFIPGCKIQVSKLDNGTEFNEIVKA